MNPPGYSRREQKGWYIYDWANSAFHTTVVTVFLGPYITTVLARQAADASGFVHPFGIPVAVRAYWEYLIAAAVALQVILLPIAGAVADYSHRKKQLLALFAYAGAGATMAMFFLKGPAYLMAGVLFLIANTAFGASVVVYNSFLPEIASPEDRDAVSSKGWAIGYLGGGLLLALNLLLYVRPGALGIDENLAVRIGLASAGLWWAAFTVIPLLALKSRQGARRLARGESAVSARCARSAATRRRSPSWWPICCTATPSRP